MLESGLPVGESWSALATPTDRGGSDVYPAEEWGRPPADVPEGRKPHMGVRHVTDSAILESRDAADILVEGRGSVSRPVVGHLVLFLYPIRKPSQGTTISGVARMETDVEDG